MAFTIGLIFSCSPQARLNRIIKHNPELAKTDTVYTKVPITIPGFNVDTTIQKNKSTAGIDSVINKFKTRIDSVIFLQLQAELQKAFIEKKCLTKPHTFNLPNGAKATITEDKNNLKLNVTKPTNTVIATVPTAINKFQVQYKYSGRMFALGFLLGFFFALFVTVQYFKRGGAA